MQKNKFKVAGSKVKSFFLITFFLFMSTFLLSGQSRFLKTDGNKIRDDYGRGNEVYLRGTNVGGWLIQEPWMTPFGDDKSEYNGDEEKMRGILTGRWDIGTSGQEALYKEFQDTWFTEQDVQNCADMGMTVLRLPIYWQNLLDTDYNWKQDPWKRIDWLVNTAEKYGIYVILDFHGLPGSQNGGDHSGKMGGADLWHNDFYKNKTEEIWRVMAARYKNNANVAGYDLFNEPGETTNETEWDFADRLYKAIRQVDSQHIIIIESTWNWSDMPDPARYGWTNVMYEFHYYNWGADFDAQSHKDFTDGKVAEAANYTHYNVPVFIGEFCGFAEEEAWRYILKTYNAQGWHWTSWTYKTTSPWEWWGIFNFANPNRPDLWNDSYNSLMENYGSWSTDRFQENSWLRNVLTEYLKQSGEGHRIDAVNPTKVQAEDFFDSYGVEKEDKYNDDGGSVGYITDGDWMAYKLDVQQGGKYDIKFRVAGEGGGGRIRFETYGGYTVFGSVHAGGTGSWDRWTETYTIEDVYLDRGTVDVAIAAAIGGFNVDWIMFTPDGGYVEEPNVNAGEDKEYKKNTTSCLLSGSASDPANLAMTYVWTKVSGPSNVNFSNVLSLTTTVSGLTAGTYEFRLSATNTANKTGSDTVTIKVDKGQEGEVTELTGNDKNKTWSINGKKSFSVPTEANGVIQVAHDWMADVQVSVENGPFVPTAADWGGQITVEANSRVIITIKTAGQTNCTLSWW